MYFLHLKDQGSQKSKSTSNRCQNYLQPLTADLGSYWWPVQRFARQKKIHFKR